MSSGLRAEPTMIIDDPYSRQDEITNCVDRVVLHLYKVCLYCKVTFTRLVPGCWSDAFSPLLAWQTGLTQQRVCRKKKAAKKCWSVGGRPANEVERGDGAACDSTLSVFHLIVEHKARRLKGNQSLVCVRPFGARWFLADFLLSAMS